VSPRESQSLENLFSAPKSIPDLPRPSYSDEDVSPRTSTAGPFVASRGSSEKGISSDENRSVSSGDPSEISSEDPSEISSEDPSEISREDPSEIHSESSDSTVSSVSGALELPSQSWPRVWWLTSWERGEIQFALGRPRSL
jgi:hypothetical protein